MKFQLEPDNRNVPSEQLLAELHRVATLLGRDTVTMHQFDEHAQFHSETLRRRFGSWFKALEAAGLGKTRNLHLTDEELFENLVAIWLRLGRQPRYADLSRSALLHSAATYERRFGTWRGALEEFVKWANEGVTSSRATPATGPVLGRRTPRNINW